MTVIVTVTDGSTITMGADSAVGNAASGEIFMADKGFGHGTTIQ